MIENFSSLAPNDIITNLCLPTFTTITMKDVDNVGEFNNIEEDEGIINEHGTHMMPLVGVMNQGHLFQEVLAIHTQEDLYMIQLLG